MWRIALLCVIASVALHAAPVRIVDANGKVVAIDGELIAGDARFALKDGLADVDVAENATVDVELRSAGWWALPATITQSGATMRVWRTGTVAGRVTAAKGVELPQSFTAYVEAPPQPMFTPAIPRGTKFECAIAKDGTFACELPAETVDLAFRSKGLTPHYRWGVAIKPKAKVDVGTLLWKRGASLVAWLDRESAKSAKGKATASLTRLIAGQPSMTAARLSVPVAEGTFTERGYVQLAPIEAGTFALQIVADGFATTTVSPIEIYEGSESVMRKPIVLEPPIDIQLALQPPLDPEGKRWHVRVDRMRDGSPMGGSSIELVADEHGEATAKGESPGRFRVHVSDARDNRVAWRDIDVQSSVDARQTITIEENLVRGTVTMSGEPLEAKLIFGMEFGAERVTLHSDAEGKFAGALPRFGTWPLEVKSDTISVIRTVDVEKEKELEIKLANTLISGEVLDRDGQRVPHALIMLSSGIVMTSSAADEHGAFSFRGYDGRVSLYARPRRGREESPRVTLDVADGQQLRDIKLRLTGTNDIRGRVTSGGQPLVGASVQATPSLPGAMPRTTTDLDGSFELSLRDDETRATFVIAAAGKTMAAFDRALSKEVMTFDLEAIGGEVRIVFPEKGGTPTFAHNGGLIVWQQLFEWTDAHGVELFAGNTAIVPDVARGVVRACVRMPEGNDVCRDATVVPRGSVTIDLR